MTARAASVVIGTSPGGDPCVLVSGELDGEASLRLRLAVADAVPAGSGLVVDLSRVTRLRTAGMRALLDERHRLRQVGGDLRLSGVSPAAARALRTAGLHRALGWPAAAASAGVLPQDAATGA